MSLHTIDKVEVFATGTWHGIKFTERDLDKIVEAFNVTKDKYKAPLKLGHNDEQALADGALSLGWVESIWKEVGADGGIKLMAKFIDVPKVIFEAVEKKLFKQISIELYKNVSFNKKVFNFVLSGVAILGSYLPEVTTLADISHYFKREGFGTSELLCFSALDQNGNLIKEACEMSITKEELTAQLAAQKAELELKFSKDDKTSQLETQLEEAKAKVLAFTKKEEDEAKKAEADKIEFSRKAVTELLDKSVTDMLITPAQKETFSKLLGVDTDSIANVDIEDVKALIGDEKASFSKDSTKNDKDKTGATEMTAGEELNFKVQEYMDSHEKVTYTTALERVMERNIELAKEHINATAGEE